MNQVPTEDTRADHDLRIAEARYRGIFEHTKNGVAVYRAENDGEDFIFVDFNQAAEKIEQLKRENVIGKSVLELFPGVRNFGLFDVFQRVWRSGNPEPHPVLFYTDGRISGWRSNFVYKLPSGEIVAVYSDETQQKMAEQELKSSHEQLANILENVGDGFFFLDKNMVFRYFNRAAGNILGRNPNDVIGKFFLDGFPEAKDSIFLDKYTHAIKTQVITHFEVYFPVMPYENWYSVHVYPFKDGISVFFQVITEQKNTLEALQESVERFQVIFEHSSLGMCMMGKDGHFILVNQTLCEMLGYTEKELFSKQFIDLTHPEDIGISKRYFEAMREGMSDSAKFEKRYLHKNGSTLWVNIGVVAFRDGQQKLKYFITYIQDNTQTKKLETQLRQASKMEAIGTLAGGIAHDFNNILFPIMGYAEMAMEEVPKDSMIHRYLGEIFKAVNRAKDLVQQILMFSRQNEHELKPIRIQTVVKEVTKLIRSTLPSTIDIRSHIDESCGPVMGDPIQIHQIMMNLCINAYHAMRDTGGGILHIQLNEVRMDPQESAIFPHLAPGIYLKLIIQDNGIGIDPLNIEKIFEPYFTTKQKSEGTGLGLSLVHGIVRKLNGYITVYSELGKGTEFHIYLPRIKSDTTQKKTKSTLLIPLGHEHILLVDDEEQILMMIKQMLENLGYQVTARVSGVDALEAFRTNPDKFDLLITDMTMPNMTGAQLSEKLLRISPNFPIILCTGFSEHISAEKAKELGIREFILKPVIRSNLANAIRNALR